MLSIRGLWLALSIAVALAALGTAAFTRWQTEAEQRIVASWRQQLAELDAATAAELALALRRQDRLAIEPLTIALADKRPPVAQAAREAIGNLVADWKRLPAREAVPRLATLAENLADHFGDYAPADQQFSRQLAQSFLLWPLEDADFLADGLVSQCERILNGPVPRLPDLAEESPPQTVESAPESLTPIVTPHVATRPQLPPAEMRSEANEQVPAPITRPPDLVVPNADDPASISTPSDAAPIEPRQFIRPRVEPIPPTVEP